MTDDVVEHPRFALVRKHPVISAIATVVSVALVVSVGILGYNRLFPPDFSCGDGMFPAANQRACAGINLTSESFGPNQDQRTSALLATVKKLNDAVTGDYVSVVLLLNLTPIARRDTIAPGNIHVQLEGAITAVWRANNTAAMGGGPKVKLFLANMGGRYAYWRQTVDKIKSVARTHRITAVVGLGQSTDETREASARLSDGDEPHLPVIGATVTGDAMNTDLKGSPIENFFRVAPTNTDSVIGMTQFVNGIMPWPDQVMIVQDKAAGDDYVDSLKRAAGQRLAANGRRVDVFPFESHNDVDRQDNLLVQFDEMHDTICLKRPQVVYFAGRGADAVSFVQSWVQGSSCAELPMLTIVSGDDLAVTIDNPQVTDALKTGKVRIFYTALANPDQWGSDCDAGGEAKANYDQFYAAFTGDPDPCTGLTINANNVEPVHFDEADLGNGQAMLTHDAVQVAVTAARKADGPDLMAHPDSAQTGIILQFRCANMLGGASGLIGFKDTNNPVNKAIPVVEVLQDGGTQFQRLTWTGNVDLRNRPTDSSQPGC